MVPMSRICFWFRAEAETQSTVESWGLKTFSLADMCSAEDPKP